MVNLKTDNATSGGYGDGITPDNMTTDSTTSGDKETTWQNQDFEKQWGYFNSCSELKQALLMKSVWVCGKGYTASSRVNSILNHISGWGKENFSNIIFNLDLMSRLTGDGFAEIIRDEDGLLLNLKVLNPGSMRIVCNEKGIIKRYEQVVKDREPIKFKPNQIFHLSHNRLADSIHGMSDLVSLYDTLDAEFESFTDIKKITHNQSMPMIIWKLKTDNSTKIAEFVAKVKEARALSRDDMFIPDDDNTVSHEVVQANISDIVLAWRTDIRNKFYRALGLPDIIFGAASGTESSSKISYLAHEQVFEHDQKFLEEAIWDQLFLKIDLISPVSLLDSMQKDQMKDGQRSQTNIQPNDLTAGRGE